MARERWGWHGNRERDVWGGGAGLDAERCVAARNLSNGCSTAQQGKTTAVSIIPRLGMNIEWKRRKMPTTHCLTKQEASKGKQLGVVWKRNLTRNFITFRTLPCHWLWSGKGTSPWLTFYCMLWDSQKVLTFQIENWANIVKMHVCIHLEYNFFRLHSGSQKKTSFIKILLSCHSSIFPEINCIHTMH